MLTSVCYYMLSPVEITRTLLVLNAAIGLRKTCTLSDEHSILSTAESQMTTHAFSLFNRATSLVNRCLLTSMF